jgi:hypothetical protein
MYLLFTDYIDIVKDPISSGDYKKEEDPKLYKSTKTQRGPLTDAWWKDYKRSGKTIMTSYKLCRVEFKYWGMQNKIERFIHEIGNGIKINLKLQIHSQ